MSTRFNGNRRRATYKKSLVWDKMYRWLGFWFVLSVSTAFAQELSVTSTAIAQVEKPQDLITVSHDTVEPGQLFFVKVKAGVSYKLQPEPTNVTTLTDDKTGDKVLIVSAGDEPITITAETKVVRITEQELRSAPSFNDPEGYSRWLSEHKVPVHDSRTILIDHGLSEFSKSVRGLARKIENEAEVKAVARNYGVVASAIETGQYATTHNAKSQVIEDVYLLNRAKVAGENSKQWNTFFKGLSELPYYRESREMEDIRVTFLEIKQGLEASLE